MPWVTPKTDWYGYVDQNGRYQGDRFNASDFNRIKNNLEILRTLSLKLTENYSINDLGADRQPGDYFYADEINQLEENLQTINEHTYNEDYGTAPTYVPNGKTMDFIELNRLESATLDLYERISTQLSGFRMFTWNFGFKGGEI